MKNPDRDEDVIPKKYQVVAYMRIDPDDPEIFDTAEKAVSEKENLEAMEFEGQNIFMVEEVDQEGWEEAP